MKAVVIHPPHVMPVDDIALVAPGPHEVTVRIQHGAICGSDLLDQPLAMARKVAVDRTVNIGQGC